MAAIRNFYMRYYKKGDYIVSMDDDLYDIITKDGNKTKPLKDFKSLIYQGYELMQTYKSGIWGVYIMQNGFYMQHNISLKLNMLVGFLYGVIVQGDDTDIVNTDHGEDSERTIKFYIKYGKVIRFNYISADTNVGKEKGGIQETRGIKEWNDGVNYIIKKYPLFAKADFNRKLPHIIVKDFSLK